VNVEFFTRKESACPAGITVPKQLEQPNGKTFHRLQSKLSFKSTFPVSASRIARLMLVRGAGGAAAMIAIVERRSK
jgi:hypothetical protein